MIGNNRITYLDGHRGLAILLVVGFHAYVRWPGFVPYGDRYAHLALFEFGWVGVDLFFMVSGFVILMTLEKCASMREFLARRWLRLFPAMLICSLLIYATAPYLPFRPVARPDLASLLPGLLFIEPSWLGHLSGIPIRELEGDFWSLYAEAKFYVFAACIYFWKGKKILVRALFLVCICSALSAFAASRAPTPWPARADLLLQVFSLDYFGWFAAGAAFYEYSKSDRWPWFAAGLCAALLSAASERGSAPPGQLAAALVAGLFALTFVSPGLRRLLGNRLLQFFGFISYPLYLIHENALIAGVAQVGRTWPELPQAWLLAPVAVIPLACIAWLIATYGEPGVRRLIQRRLLPGRKTAPPAGSP